eukprot:TRINITY_DN9157_c0_g3_i3.p1 TRINITY_DN9157_c0_g3~~TRINITY_DN9157_c0_g3_i3.p1  ORF type:complete len:387 (+),score=44.09 TRINITY_DN9157_c0_g3_i3:312-1472(+)
MDFQQYCKFPEDVSRKIWDKIDQLRSSTQAKATSNPQTFGFTSNQHTFKATSRGDTEMLVVPDRPFPVYYKREEAKSQNTQLRVTFEEPQPKNTSETYSEYIEKTVKLDRGSEQEPVAKPNIQIRALNELEMENSILINRPLDSGRNEFNPSGRDEELKTYKINRAVGQPFNYKFTEVTISTPRITTKLRNDGRELILCRSKNTDGYFPLGDSTVSSQHAMIKWSQTKKAFILKDLGSTSGTYIQAPDIEITEKLVLEIGDFQYKFIKIDRARREITARVEEDLVQSRQVYIGTETPIIFGSKKQRLTLGSAGCDVPLRDPTILGCHGEFVWEGTSAPRLITTQGNLTWKRISDTRIPSEEMVIPPKDSEGMRIRCGEAPVDLTFR